MDFQEILNNYYTLPEERQASLRKTILEKANGNPDRFRSAIGSTDLETDEHLPVIYEALAEDSEHWGAFFIEEAERIIKAAEKIKKPYHVLCLLDEFIFLDLEHFAEREALVEILKRGLQHAHPTFRYFAVNLLPEFMGEEDAEILELLREKLEDKDWRVRYWAHKNLQDMNQLPEGYKASFHDRFLSRISNTMKFD